MDKEEVDRMIAAAVKPLKEENEELRKQHSDLQSKFSKLTDEKIETEKELKELKAEQEEQEGRAEKLKINHAREAATEVLEEAVKLKKITPAARDKAVKLFGIDDDEKVVKLDLDDIREFYEFTKEDVAKMKRGEEGSAAGGSDDEEADKDRTYKSVFHEADHRIKVQMSKDSKMSYADAMKVVFTADPDLHREYLTTTPPEKFEATPEKASKSKEAA